jgi:hypothetical protein
MAKGSAWANELLLLIYNAVSTTNLATSTGATDIYVALHTGDPTGGTAATNEATYGGYSRIAVARTSGGWTVSGNQVQNVAEILFNASNDATSETITHFSTTDAATGTSRILHTGAASPNVPISNGVQPKVNPNGITITES